MPQEPASVRPASRSVSLLRAARPLHRWVGVPSALFLFIISITGILLGWKKDIALLQPPTARGIATQLSEWRATHEIADSAQAALAQHLQRDPADLPIDRLDARPARGIVKVLFATGYWEVQIDAASLDILSIARRHCDWIEEVHDGSIIGDTFKVVAMSVFGLALAGLNITGFWLWYGPIHIRRRKQRPAA